MNAPQRPISCEIRTKFSAFMGNLMMMILFFKLIGFAYRVQKLWWLHLGVHSPIFFRTSAAKLSIGYEQ